MMIRRCVISALAWAAGLALATPSGPPLMGVRTRNFPGTSDEFTLNAVRRHLAALAHVDTDLKNSTVIEQSWNDAVLFTLGKDVSKSKGNTSVDAGVQIEIKCTACYLKAGITAELSINGTFDLGNVLQNLTAQFGEDLQNLTQAGVNFLEAEFKNARAVLNELETLVESRNASVFELVNTVTNFSNVGFDTSSLSPPPLPEVQILFQIDHLDLFVEIDTTISADATLTIPLYKSESAFGVSAGDNTEIGFFVTMDLILSVEGELDIRSGFHLLLDQPVGFHIDLFGNSVSNVIFNGGKFEFLPVILVKGEVALKAILRVGMHAGIDISSDVYPIPGDIVLSNRVADEVKKAFNFSAGMEVGVYAHVAEFLTNITGGASLAAEDGCALKIIEEYTLGVGATAGATLAIADHTWGPQPATTVPIFYTTLADVCAVTAHASTSTTSAATTPSTTGTTTGAARRQAAGPLTTTTLTTTALFTGVGCASPALQALCPQSLQTTSIQTSTLTLITAVPSGVTPTFPATTATTVPSTSAFGKNANKLAATSGVPTSFVPPPPASSSSPGTGTTSASASATSGILNDIGNFVNGETDGVSNKLIIGLAVGLGLPLVMALVSIVTMCIRRARYTPLPRSDNVNTHMNMMAVEYTGGYATSQSQVAAEREGMLKKGPGVSVGEVSH